jgi:hypothetical protein
MKKNWTIRKPGKSGGAAVIVHGSVITIAGLSLVQWGVYTEARKVLLSLSNNRFVKHSSFTADEIFEFQE